jgi:serine/threonine-protein kinase
LFLARVFEHARPDENRGRAMTAHEILEKGETQMGALAHDPALRVDVGALLGTLYVEIGDHARAESLLKAALAGSEDPRVPDDVRARVLLGMGTIAGEAGAYREAMSYGRRALALLEAASVRDAVEIADAHQILAYGLVAGGDLAAAEAAVRGYLEQDRAALGDTHELVSELRIVLGRILGERGLYQESEAAFRKGIDSLSLVYGENSHHVAHALNELSNMLDDKGDLAGAEAALRRALAIRLETVGPDHRSTVGQEHNLLVVVEFRGRYREALPKRLELLGRATRSAQLHPIDIARLNEALGIDYRELGMLREAEGTCRRALTLLQQAQGSRGPGSINARRHLGLVLQLDGRYAEAAAVFREALAIQLEHGSPTAPSVAVTRAHIGNLLRLQHRYDEAVQELKGASEALASAKALPRVQPTVLAALGEAQLDAGDGAAARASAEAALRAARRSFSDGHPLVAAALFALARAEIALGNPGTAEPLLREALALRTPLLPADDPRLLEVQVARVGVLEALGRGGEAGPLRTSTTARLRRSRSPYAADLLARLRTRAVVH